MTAYYNEIDPHAAHWLRNLIAAGHIAPGDVDERSIEDVKPNELRGYTQCHFFTGIGGWAYALDLAGWPRDRPVWTGSCPCQPFSAAGKGTGFEDERHLWPAWQHLIAQCKPAIVFGEQVASTHADAWIDLVHADLEGVGYAFGCVPAPAAGFGSPQVRDRLYWLADASGARGAVGLSEQAQRQGGLSGVSDDGCSEHVGAGRRPTAGAWSDADWLLCRDGKLRPVEPGTFPLAHGLPARVGRLRAYGNAIVPQQAAEFIRAYVAARDLGLMEAAA